jgi:hypothetical protein
MFVSAMSVAKSGEFLCTSGISCEELHVWDIPRGSIKAKLKVGGMCDCRR